MNDRGKEGDPLAGCKIREARLEDAAAMARLVSELGFPSSAEEMRERLRVIFARVEYITFVAEGSGGIVGMVGAYVGHAFGFDPPCGRLTGLAVDEAWRGRGIGRLLMKHMEDWLRGKGAKVLILTSASQRREAHRFYRRLGYEVTGVRFAKNL